MSTLPPARPHPSMRAASIAWAVWATLSCGDTLVDPAQEDRCPLPQGEFGPTDCAIVRGVARDLNGQLLRMVPIRVDSVIPLVAYVYASALATTDDQGAFTLTVFRASRLTPITNPDTATVELKAYDHPNPNPRDIPMAKAPVRMTFAELGKPVTPTIVEAVFDIPR